LLGTAYVSRRLLPLQSNLGWSEGFRLLWRNYTRGAANLLYGRPRAKPTSPAAKKKKSTAPTRPPSFDLIGAGYLLSHEAAAIKAGNSYRRAGGPGLVILHRGESVAQVFDLRPQSRKLPIEATTRDGILVKTSVSVTFQVRRPSPTQRRPRSVEADVLPYPYDRDALFDLYYASSVANDEKRNWTEQVCPQAATLLISEIGKYTLDELLVSAAAEPLGEIKDRIKNALQERQGEDQMQTLSKGIDVVSVGIGPLELPPEVTTKRLTTWQVEWQNRVDRETTTGAIEAQRLFHQAQANALVENVENLLLSIEDMRRQSGVELHEVFMRQLIEVLESATTSRALRPLASRLALSGMANEAADELRQALEEDGD
jgi:regulator of protease activity HflC (stomatin/prohibitin superfamily)